MPRICVAFAALSVCILASGCGVSIATHEGVLAELEKSRTDVGELKTKVEEAEESKKLVEEQLLGRNKDLAATIEKLTDTVGQAKKEVQDINKDLLQAQTLLTAAKRKAVDDQKQITAANAKAKQAEANAKKASALAADLIVENAKLKKNLAESESRIEKLLIEEEPASATEDAAAE
ncbi:MAG: hypothetical protein HQ592_14440 [Planctomycetes bacterium]|nr:hypothetical protein [Planctomycetota bacterium]